MLVCDFEKNNLLELLLKQLSNFYFIDNYEIKLLKDNFECVWSRIAECFAGIDNKYFFREGIPYFNPYHSGQYLIYLYIYSNTCSMNNEKITADKLYYLNKIMHACDIYHEIELPQSFFLEHPVGTVLGRAVYGNNFFAMQNCTIGGNKGKYPILGEGVKLLSGSKILGNSKIGDNVTISASSYVKDTDIPDNATVFGMSPNLTIKYL